MQKKFMIAAFVALVLSACSSTGTLQSAQPENKISGTVKRGAFEPHQVEVTLDGKTYRGEWRTSAPTTEQRAAAGLPHQYHVKQVRSTLRSDDGKQLDCQWQTHGESAEGACRADGREYPLNLE